jgi:orotidine-5'-phosphate decarboxylase
MRKKTNLIVSIDESDISKVLEMTFAVAPYVCAIKYHSDVWDTSECEYKQLESFRKLLFECSRNNKFLIFEDRKFADIGAIVQKQYSRLQKNYFDDKTIDLVTVLPCAGRGTVDSIVKNTEDGVGVLLVSQLSTNGSLLDDNFTKKCVELSKSNPKYISGFIVQKRISNMTDDRFVYCTPGVREDTASDSHDQRYRTIEDAIVRDGCDVIIVGRGITSSENVKDIMEKAKWYAEKAFKCYTDNITLTTLTTLTTLAI